MVLEGNPNWWIAILLGIVIQSALILVMLSMLRKNLQRLV